MGAAASVQPGASPVADSDSGQPAAAHRDVQPNSYGLTSDTLTEPDRASLAGRVTGRAAGTSLRTMTTLRGALPLVRALVLAGLAIYLILFALPTILGIAAAATP